MKKILRYFATRSTTEHIEPGKYGQGFFEKRLLNDSLARYKFAIPYCEQKSVLDIACGDGYGTAMIAHVAHRVIGVDNSQHAVDHASDIYAHTSSMKNVTFRCSDAIQYLQSHPQTFDVITTFETVEHIKDYLAFIHFLFQRLKKNGILIMSTPDKKFSDMFYGGTINPYHVKEFYAGELLHILQNVFTNTPHLFLQRPVHNRYAFLSGVFTMIIHEKSVITPATIGLSGLDNIYVVRKI